MFRLADNPRWDSRLAMPRVVFDSIVSLMRGADFNFADYAARLASSDRYASGVGDLAMRVRWDAFWLIFRDLRNGDAGDAWRDADLNDAAIDSALRRIVVPA